MDTNQVIIRDLREKVGFNAEVDFMNMWKGMPVVFRGSIKEFQPDGIVFDVKPPDSVCLANEPHTMILHDIFLTAIQGDVVSFDITTGLVKLHNFTYADQGFGKRSIVRVQPKDPIQTAIVIGEREILGVVEDISLSGFGIQIGKIAGDAIHKGDSLILKTHLQDRDVEIPGTVLGVFGKGKNTRIAVNFEHDAPGHAVVARYITHRRAEIRKEITDAYHKLIGEHA